jgi:EAL domain-containing protein (putative c-di-GMP-specific phosphodiesterase class I)
MAFQPIVDVETGLVFAHEALVRGNDGAGAAAVLAGITDENRYRFDQTCRVRAITQAAALGMRSVLPINFLPNAIYEPSACIRTTVEAATRTGFPLDSLMFELTEAEAVVDPGKLREVVTYYRARGFLTAIDDFGAGFAGLNLLAEFVPDVVKIDMALVRDLHVDATRRAIVRSVVGLAEELGMTVLAEGIEVPDEARALRDLGIRLQQGYLFARPGFDTLPPVSDDAQTLVSSDPAPVGPLVRR